MTNKQPIDDRNRGLPTGGSRHRGSPSISEPRLWRPIPKRGCRQSRRPLESTQPANPMRREVVPWPWQTGGPMVVARNRGITTSSAYNFEGRGAQYRWTVFSGYCFTTLSRHDEAFASIYLEPKRVPARTPCNLRFLPLRKQLLFGIPPMSLCSS